MSDTDPIGLFTYVVEELEKKKVGLLEVSENFTFDATNDELSAAFFANLEHKNIRSYLRPKFSGAYMDNG